MGKPFESELASLKDTYRWANGTDISSLIDIQRRTSSLPRIAIGSGGSITAAEFLCELHAKYNGQLAKTMTPLEAINSIPENSKLSVQLLSAGGNNPDILYCYEQIAATEPKQLAVICGDPDSQLIASTARNSYVDTFPFSIPSGKDGFLAVNSLLAFYILLSRCYRSASGMVFKHPPSLSKLWRSAFSCNLSLSKLDHRCSVLWKKKTIIVLYSPTFKSVALDIESKFTEAALGNVQIADYRNFAHGRHHWIAKHGEDTGIISFCSPHDTRLAESTLSVLPSTTPIVHIPMKSDETEAHIGLLVMSFHLAGWAGQARKIDPGRPGVPTFGSKLYDLRLPHSYAKLSINEDTAIFLKSGVPTDKLKEEGSYGFWKSALGTFKRRLASARFCGVVFDYDDTLVDSRHRYYLPTKDIVEELTRLLSLGLPIGIATGRGKSVRKDLQSVLPKKYWKQVLLGYYNGGEIGTLDNDAVPTNDQIPREELAAFSKILSDDPELSLVATIESRHTQITVVQNTPLPEERLWDLTNQHLKKLKDTQLIVVRSSHSIDVLAPGVSKLSLISAFHRTYNLKSPILTIGDRGRWPGNDHELLAEPYSLSADEVSTDPDTCWNLSPPGYRGIQATLFYCKKLVAVNAKATVRVQYKKSREEA